MTRDEFESVVTQFLSDNYPALAGHVDINVRVRVTGFMATVFDLEIEYWVADDPFNRAKAGQWKVSLADPVGRGNSLEKANLRFLGMYE